MFAGKCEREAPWSIVRLQAREGLGRFGGPSPKPFVPGKGVTVPCRAGLWIGVERPSCPDRAPNAMNPAICRFRHAGRRHRGSARLSRRRRAADRSGDIGVATARLRLDHRKTDARHDDRRIETQSHADRAPDQPAFLRRPVAVVCETSHDALQHVALLSPGRGDTRASVHARGVARTCAGILGPAIG